MKNSKSELCDDVPVFLRPSRCEEYITVDKIMNVRDALVRLPLPLLK